MKNRERSIEDKFVVLNVGMLERLGCCHKLLGWAAWKTKLIEEEEIVVRGGAGAECRDYSLIKCLFRAVLDQVFM